ncbi:MAG: 4Fe-4S binding protein [Clostridiales bacterium]|nr:4Fe-4S binding protein [Clostridiales bacterium]
MIRRIITIDEEKCNGCGLCAKACHEGAIGLVEGKARLLREDYCDGLGDCLPACPMNAISFEEREAPAYDEAAVMAAKRAKEALPCGCPGTACQSIPAGEAASWGDMPSCLTNFPIQLQLAPVSSPWFQGAELLIAADCTAYAYGSFHRDFMRGRVTLIGCPKLDPVHYADKLTEIFRRGDIRGVTLTRMTVPCCGGLAHAVRTAIEQSGKDIPLRIVTISPDGKLVQG